MRSHLEGFRVIIDCKRPRKIEKVNISQQNLFRDDEKLENVGGSSSEGLWW